jgi:hypothetical protein
MYGGKLDARTDTTKSTEDISADLSQSVIEKATLVPRADSEEMIGTRDTVTCS